VKIVAVHTIINCGYYAASRHWRQTRKADSERGTGLRWPPGSGSFTIYPQSGQEARRGQWSLSPPSDFRPRPGREWVIEDPPQKRARRSVSAASTRFLPAPEGPGRRMETGTISSSHRSNETSLIHARARVHCPAGTGLPSRRPTLIYGPHGNIVSWNLTLDSRSSPLQERRLKSWSSSTEATSDRVRNSERTADAR